MKRYPSTDERSHAEWSETLPDMQTKATPPIHAPVPLKDFPLQMTTGQAIVVVGTLAVPTIFFAVFDYQLYFFAVTHTQTLIVAGVLTPVWIFGFFSSGPKQSKNI